MCSLIVLLDFYLVNSLAQNVNGILWSVYEIAFFLYLDLDCAPVAIGSLPKGAESSLASYFLFLLIEEGFNTSSSVGLLQVFMCVTQKFTFKQGGNKRKSMNLFHLLTAFFKG